MSGDYASIVIIKRSGGDGPRFPLRRNECLFGRDTSCDLRVQLPGVALEHAKVSRSENNDFVLENLSEFETMINGNPMKEAVGLRNKDVFSIAGRIFRFEYEQPRRKSLGQKRLSLNTSRSLVSPLKEANHVVKDSPRNPVPRRASLRESLGKLRRSSVPCEEVEEPLANTPEKVEKQANPMPRRTSLRESIGKLRRSSVVLQEVQEPLSNTPEEVEEQLNPLPRRMSFRESMGALRRSSVAFQEHEEEPRPNTPGAAQLNSATPTPKSYATTPLSTKKQRKRVSFGPTLSPEQFDKALPVSTPVRKGATPRRLSAPLSKPCISPARRRYSVAATSFASKIEEEDESDDEDVDPPTDGSPNVEIVDVLQTDWPKLATPLRAEIKEGKKLRARNKKMRTPMKNAIKQGFRLKATKKKLNTPLRKEIHAGKMLRPTRKRLNTPVRQAIEAKPKLRATRMRMPTPVRQGIEAKPSLRQTKKTMKTHLQEEIKKGMSLRQTKKVMPEPLQDEIKNGRKFLRIRRRMKSELQGEIVAGKELNVTKKKMAVELQTEIVKGVQLRPTRKRMPTMLQEEIKSGIELSKTKQSLKTPLKKEIESGVNLRKTKRRMGTMLQDEIKSGVELAKTKQSLKTPIRKEIESGVKLRKIKRRMPTVLQSEIQSGIELSKTKQSLKTPLRKQIETGIQLRSTKPKDEAKPAENSKTPKRRFSSVDDDAPRSTRKKLKTPSKTPQQAGFFPSTRSRTRSVSRRKSTKKPSYAEIVRRPKIVAKRRLSTKQKNVFKFEAEQQVLSKSTAVGTKPAGNRSEASKKSKTPRRKSLARSKVFDGKTASEWNVVVNKRKIKKIKRQRAVKPQQDIDMEGVSSLFKTPKATRSQALVETGKEETPVGRPVGKCEMSSSPDDAVLYGVAKLMKTPKIKPSTEPDIEGVAELFEVLEMASPIPVSKTPSLRRASDRVSIVTPLSINKTPSLRLQQNLNDVVFPLQLSSTPSLRTGTENVTVACAQELLRTPSLRRDSEVVTVVSVEELAHTPSLSHGENNLTVVMAATPNATPSLKKSAENVVVSSPVLASVTPSLKDVPSTTPSPTEISQSSSAKKQPKSVAVVSPFPVQSTSFEMQPTSATEEPSLQQQTLPSDDLPPDLVDQVPATSPETTVAKRSTRSKRKIESESLPAAKRPRRATSRSNSKVGDENAESEIELSNSRASTRSRKNAVTSHPQEQKQTRARSSKQPPVTAVDVEEPAEDKVVPKNRRTTRARRVLAEPTPTTLEPTPTEQPIPEDLTSKPPTDEEPTSKTTRSRRSKAAVVPSFPQVEKRTRRSTSRNNNTNIVNEKETNDENSITSEGARKTRARSAKQQSKKNQQKTSEVVEMAEEQLENEIDLENKRNTRGSRRKPTNAKGKGKSNSKSKIPTRSEESKNVAGIPETPQPLQFTKTKLEPIIEVPTPASSLGGSAIKKSLLESQPKGRRDISTVIEEVVIEEPSMPSSKGRASRSKRAVAAEKSVEKSKEATMVTASNEKRVTRAKRQITAVVTLEDLPASKRQKKEAAKAGDGDGGKTAEQEKRAGRHTRRGAKEEKVVEEVTISNTRSTRRKKPAAVKDIEIVEETVVTYTRTTRQRSKPGVEESTSVKNPSEEKNKRVRKGNDGSETINEDSRSRTKTRTARQKGAAAQESGNVEKVVGKEMKVGRSRGKRAAVAEGEVTERVTRTTRSRRAAK